MKTFSKKLKELRDCIDIQSQNGNWNYDPYMHGLLNGMLMAESIMAEDDAAFRDAPPEWLHKPKKWYQFWK